MVVPFPLVASGKQRSVCGNDLDYEPYRLNFVTGLPTDSDRPIANGFYYTR
jgi:hypothetical protein